MFYVLCWLVVLSLLAMWSLAAWAIHAVAVWTLANAAALAPGSGAMESLQVPPWLAPWIPSELALTLTSMALALKPAVDALLGWAPSLAGGLSVAVWVVWAIGGVVLIVLGGVLSALIAVLRKRSTAPTTQRLRPGVGG